MGDLLQGRKRMFSTNRCFIAVAMLTMCVLSAPADEISPEMLVESDYSGPTESIGASTNPLIPHLYSGEEHGYDENDFHASTGHKNSEGLDVNLGNGVKAEHFGDNSFDTNDAYTDEKTGHYYQGNGRRRVGGGFGHGRSVGARRRSIKAAPLANPGDIPEEIPAPMN